MSTPKWPGDHEAKHRAAAKKGWARRKGQREELASVQTIAASIPIRESFMERAAREQEEGRQRRVAARSSPELRKLRKLDAARGAALDRTRQAEKDADRGRITWDEYNAIERLDRQADNAFAAQARKLEAKYGIRSYTEVWY